MIWRLRTIKIKKSNTRLNIKLTLFENDANRVIAELRESINLLREISNELDINDAIEEIKKWEELLDMDYFVLNY